MRSGAILSAARCFSLYIALRSRRVHAGVQVSFTLSKRKSRLSKPMNSCANQTCHLNGPEEQSSKKVFYSDAAVRCYSRPKELDSSFFGWVEIEFLVSTMAAESRTWTLCNLWWLCVLIFCLRHCISSSPYSSSLYAVHENMQSERLAWKPTSGSVHLLGPPGFVRECKKKQMFLGQISGIGSLLKSHVYSMALTQE